MTRYREGSSTGGSGGIGICGAFLILFVALKLLNKIDWPWIWVLSPVWIPVLIFIALTLLALVIKK